MKLSNQTLAVLVLAAPLTANASCVQEKVDDWVASNNTLYQDLTCNCTMGSDSYKAAAAACSSEIDKYTAAAEESCQLEKEYDSPQNYGDRWLQVMFATFVVSSCIIHQTICLTHMILYDDRLFNRTNSCRHQESPR